MKIDCEEFARNCYRETCDIQKQLLDAGFEKAKHAQTGTFLWKGDWYIPRFGCDSLAHLLDEVESI